VWAAYSSHRRRVQRQASGRLVHPTGIYGLRTLRKSHVPQSKTLKLKCANRRVIPRCIERPNWVRASTEAQDMRVHFQGGRM